MVDAVMRRCRGQYVRWVCDVPSIVTRKPPDNEKGRGPKTVPDLIGVADGTRTRDSQDHNLVLYQLNYSHHHCPEEQRG